MKIKSCLEDAREDILRALEFVKGVPVTAQASIAQKTSDLLREVDIILSSLDRLESNKTEENLDKKWNEIWKNSGSIDDSWVDYKLMVLRLEPQKIKDTKISGYLKTFHLPTTIPEIIEDIGIHHGGGKYQLRFVDDRGKFVKQKTFEISGMPKIPEKNN